MKKKHLALFTLLMGLMLFLSSSALISETPIGKNVPNPRYECEVVQDGLYNPFTQECEEDQGQCYYPGCAGPPNPIQEGMYEIWDRCQQSGGTPSEDSPFCECPEDAVGIETGECKYDERDPMVSGFWFFLPIVILGGLAYMIYSLGKDGTIDFFKTYSGVLALSFLIVFSLWNIYSPHSIYDWAIPGVGLVAGPITEITGTDIIPGPSIGDVGGYIWNSVFGAASAMTGGLIGGSGSLIDIHIESAHCNPYFQTPVNGILGSTCMPNFFALMIGFIVLGYFVLVFMGKV